MLKRKHCFLPILTFLRSQHPGKIRPHSFPNHPGINWHTVIWLTMYKYQLDSKGSKLKRQCFLILVGHERESIRFKDYLQLDQKGSQKVKNSRQDRKKTHSQQALKTKATKHATPMGSFWNSNTEDNLLPNIQASSMSTSEPAIALLSFFFSCSIVCGDAKLPRTTFLEQEYQTKDKS